LPEQNRPGLVIRGAMEEAETWVVRLDPVRPAPREEAPLLPLVAPPAVEEAAPPESGWRAWGRWLWLAGLVAPLQYARARARAAQKAAARSRAALRGLPNSITPDRHDG